mgnify:CR=1 FL=1
MDDDFRDQVFGALSGEDKRDNFERSTLKLVLGQIGWTKARIEREAEDLGPGFSWDWFNDLNLTGRARIGSTRVFQFNFDDILFKPSHHPITEAFREFKGDSADPCCLVFKVSDRGRWVATNLKTDDDTSIRVVVDGAKLRFNLLPFPSFFFNRWSQTNG